MARRRDTKRSRSPYSATNEGNRRHKNKKRKSHRLLATMIFFLLLIYLSGYIMAFAVKPSTPIEAVDYGSIDTPVLLKGIIVRSETVIRSPREGHPVYAYGDNERVKKDAVVCRVKNSETVDMIEEKINKIDQDILKKQKMRKDISLFSEDVKNIEQHITEIVDSNVYKFTNDNISGLYKMKEDIDSRIEMRNHIWLTENVDSLAALSQEKMDYENQLAQNTASVTSPVSGIVSLKYDQFEEVLTVDKLNEVTKEQTKMNSKPVTISKSSDVNANDVLFKIIDSNRWYIVSYVPLSIAQGFQVGNIKKLMTILYDEEKTFDAEISEIQMGEEDARIVFSTSKNLIDFLELRNIEFRIGDDSLQGLKIPNNSIVEKTLLKLPIACVKESGGERGVLKVIGEETKFTPLSILKIDSQNPDGTGGFAYVQQMADTLKIGDIVVQGEENSNRYTVSDVVTYSGVYVVNSSVARFVIIDVLGENNDYSIVAPGSGSYGLQVYDNIASDAKSLQESDFVYN